MQDPHFFGYGSLVNLATHSYPNARKASLSGWRRAWICTPQREIVFLTAVPASGDSIQGLIAAVPDADWKALDHRESGYARVPSGDSVTHSNATPLEIAHYSVPAETMCPINGHAILLSYLDVVVQGYLQQFGEAGVQAFFDTTDGWHTPILNDRQTPRYPRAQTLDTGETQLVDDHLKRLAARVQHTE